MKDKPVDLSANRRSLFALMAPQSSFLWVIVVYGITISLMTLAVPIAVQTLINTIANIGSLRAVYILAITLFLILLAYGALSALRIWVVERYERHVYARLTAEMSQRVLRAPKGFFQAEENHGLTHRYFDIMIFQKNVPSLFADGFALLLQMLVGFTLVSFYHLWLFLFNVLVVAMVYAIWIIWSGGARRTAIYLSRKKHDAAKWLGDLELEQSNYHCAEGLDVVAECTDQATRDYIQCRKHHFRYTFTQTLMFLLLYALGSSGLLALGGWLVNAGQLSIGQLVAAELIMASIFVGLSRFSIYLKYYYELCGAADKVTEVLTIPQDPIAVESMTNGATNAGEMGGSHA